jgi:hypothetical protein
VPAHPGAWHAGASHDVHVDGVFSGDSGSQVSVLEELAWACAQFVVLLHVIGGHSLLRRVHCRCPLWQRRLTPVEPLALCRRRDAHHPPDPGDAAASVPVEAKVVPSASGAELGLLSSWLIMVSEPLSPLSRSRGAARSLESYPK